MSRSSEKEPPKTDGNEPGTPQEQTKFVRHLLRSKRLSSGSAEDTADLIRPAGSGDVTQEVTAEINRVIREHYPANMDNPDKIAQELPSDITSGNVGHDQETATSEQPDASEATKFSSEQIMLENKPNLREFPVFMLHVDSASEGEERCETRL